MNTLKNIETLEQNGFKETKYVKDFIRIGISDKDMMLMTVIAMKLENNPKNIELLSKLNDILLELNNDPIHKQWSKTE